MSDQDRYIPGVPCWVDTSQPDPEAAVAFYRDLFGWEFEDVMPPDAPRKYFIARIRGGDVAAVGSQPEGAPSTAVWNTYVWVADAAQTTAKVRAADGKVLSEPMDVMEAGRMAVCADPAGATFNLWQPKQHRGATVVNEHGALNFNNLHTPDIAGAREFYAAVFGWDLLEMGGAGGMWALPAYGDFLEQRTPGFRANVAQMGGPPRFEEVVASLVEDMDTPAHWGVTFGVDDADTVAARAKDLGGRVVAAPFDAPWVRMTVIADPQGALFTASQFVPENKDTAQPADTATTA
jgi:predicted enzyme related to lactoylglutathione lyase